MYSNEILVKFWHILREEVLDRQLSCDLHPCPLTSSWTTEASDGQRDKNEQLASLIMM